MDTRNLLTFKTILAEGSFQKAARRLNYSQSTITFQIRQLENELSVQLFDSYFSVYFNRFCTDCQKSEKDERNS